MTVIMVIALLFSIPGNFSKMFPDFSTALPLFPSLVCTRVHCKWRRPRTVVPNQVAPRVAALSLKTWICSTMTESMSKKAGFLIASYGRPYLVWRKYTRCQPILLWCFVFVNKLTTSDFDSIQVLSCSGSFLLSGAPRICHHHNKLISDMVENTLSCNMRYVWPRSKYLLLRVIFTQTI